MPPPAGPRHDPSVAPLRALDVEPTRLRASGGGRTRAALALAIMIGVLAVGVVLDQRSSPDPPPDVAERASVPVALVVHPAPSATTRPARTIPDRLGPSELADAVRDGSLDGRLVIIDGSMDATAVEDCGSLGEIRLGCVGLHVAGLDVPIWPADDFRPWPGDPPVGARLVTVARHGGLAYIGALVATRGGPTSLEALDRELADVPPELIPTSLFEATGVLVARAPGTCSGACGSPPPYLGEGSIEVPWYRPAHGVAVSLAVDMPGIDPGAAVADGTFLVRPQSGGIGWQVVARYVPGRFVRVQAP